MAKSAAATWQPGSAEGDAVCPPPKRQAGPIESPLVRPLRKRKHQQSSEDRTKHAECAMCRNERASKARVATDAGDPRFVAPKFISAPAIFANNDVKYDTNKMRAQKFAAERRASITYAPAKDTPSQEALRERSTLHLEKMKWLQRHDRESGDLYTTQTTLPPRLPQRDH